MKTKDILSSCLESKEQEIQRMQKQAKILKESSMDKFNVLKTTTQRLEQNIFPNCPLFQQKSNSTNKLHEKDSKSDLSVIRDKFLHSEELKPSNYDGRHKRLKRLNDRKLKIQECKVQEVTTPNASSGDTDSGGFISDNGNAHSSENDCNKTGNAQSSEKQSSTYGNESSRSRNECTERSNSRDDTDIKPSYDT
ncbi:hypothetical protein Tco_0115701 [Tanacetum coccineum]